MRKNVVTALLIATGITLWLLSGLIGGPGPQDGAAAPSRDQAAASVADGTQLTRVRARVIEAEPRVRRLVLRGRTENKRTVEVKSEIAGRVEQRAVERGAQVAEGDVLCKLTLEDRAARVAEANAALQQAQIEYEGSQRLRKQGLQSETAIAQSAAALARARTELTRAELDLANTNIRAPFAGVVEQIHLNVGDYVTPGSTCVTLLDLDPMLVTAQVTERDVAQIREGSPVLATTINNDRIEGTLTYIGSQSDQATRTYPIEATVANGDYQLRSGMTTTLQIALGSTRAHLVSPALFTLSDDGRVGVRILDEDDRVQFVPVSIIEDTPAGAWISGLPERTRIITTGQEFVSAGQRVEVVMENDPEDYTS